MPKPAPDDIVRIARQEWEHWGKSTWNCITGKKSKGFHIDDDNVFAQYVIDTYLPPFYKTPVKWPTLTAISEDDYPWSAVTISHFMLQSGFSRKRLLPEQFTAQQYKDWVAGTKADQFPVSEGHSDYIRWAIRARKDSIETAAYWGYRVDEPDAKPEIGDLVGYPRAKNMTRKKALGFFAETSAYQSHTDLVVAKRAGEIDVIGGNVRDSVTKKTLKINADGRLADQTHFWFVVLKARP